MEIRKEGGLRGAGAPDEARLAKINAYARTPLTAEAVYCFRVRLCDDRPDRDFERFDTAALPRMRGAVSRQDRHLRPRSGRPTGRSRAFLTRRSSARTTARAA